MTKICEDYLLKNNYEVPFINASEATKRSRDRTENGKCTNVMNRRNLESSQPHIKLFTGQNSRTHREYVQNTFRIIKNDNKRKYLQQEDEKYSKDCFGNK